MPMTKTQHRITVTETLDTHNKFLVQCSCACLVIDVPEKDVGRIIRIHWNVEAEEDE